MEVPPNATSRVPARCMLRRVSQLCPRTQLSRLGCRERLSERHRHGAGGMRLHLDGDGRPLWTLPAGE